MGRGERTQASQASGLLFGPRRARPLSDQERNERNAQLRKERDQELDQVKDYLNRVKMLEMVISRASVSSYQLGYGGQRLAEELKGDGYALVKSAETLDEDLLNKAGVERKQIAQCGDDLVRAASNLPYLGFSPTPSRRMLAAEAINRARREALVGLSPIVKKLRDVVEEEQERTIVEAHRGYCQGLLRKDSYQDFIDNIDRSYQLLADPTKIDNIFREGRCLEDLAEQLKDVGEDEVAGDLTLAEFHISVNDRPDEYAQRARRGLAGIAEQLGLDLIG